MCLWTIWIMIDLTTFSLSVGVDFEMAFINALRKVFPDARLIGCLFHWKQAIRRKLLELGFPKEVTSFIMKPGNLDLLTVLPLKDVATVDSKGPLYVCCRIESPVGMRTMKLPDGKKILISEWFQSPDGTEKMLLFWQYMDRQWFNKKGMISLWNLSDLISSSTGLYRLISRTNCAMERYNRTFNEVFPRRHPNLSAFVAGVNEESDRQVAWLHNIASGREHPPTYDDIPFPVIPEDYADFNVPSVENYSLMCSHDLSTVLICLLLLLRQRRVRGLIPSQLVCRPSRRVQGLLMITLLLNLLLRPVRARGLPRRRRNGRCKLMLMDGPS